jgi:transcriptional regulator with XRE-family HTH domain
LRRFIFTKLFVYLKQTAVSDSFYKEKSLLLQNSSRKFYGGSTLDLGKKIKQMRNQKGLTQEELADRCELTKGYISQLENNLNSPSIATLTDILAALGSNLSEFFKEETEEKTVFTKEEFIEKDSDGVLWKWLIPNAQKNMMEPVLVELAEGAETSGDIPHEGEEFGYVLEGKLAVVLGNKYYACKKGDAFYFTAGKPHRVINKGKGKAKFLWISTPPNF